MTRTEQELRFTDRQPDQPFSPEPVDMTPDEPPAWAQTGNMITLRWAGPPALNVQVEYAGAAGGDRHRGRVVSWDEVAGEPPLKIDQEVEFTLAQVHWVEPGASASS